MLVLYPVTIGKLVRQKFLGNGKSSVDAVRKKQNISVDQNVRNDNFGPRFHLFELLCCQSYCAVLKFQERMCLTYNRICYKTIPCYISRC